MLSALGQGAAVPVLILVALPAVASNLNSNTNSNRDRGSNGGGRGSPPQAGRRGSNGGGGGARAGQLPEAWEEATVAAVKAHLFAHASAWPLVLQRRVTGVAAATLPQV